MAAETNEDMLNRLDLMASDDPKWDLSPNDRAAIQHALSAARRTQQAEALVGPVNDRLDSVLSRQREIREFLEEEIGTGWDCDACKAGNYNCYGPQCQNCGSDAPLLHRVAFKLHATDTEHPRAAKAEAERDAALRAQQIAERDAAAMKEHAQGWRKEADQHLTEQAEQVAKRRAVEAERDAALAAEARRKEMYDAIVQRQDALYAREAKAERERDAALKRAEVAYAEGVEAAAKVAEADAARCMQEGSGSPAHALRIAKALRALAEEGRE